MAQLTQADKKKLKHLAHHLKPVVMVGKNGITETLLKAISQALHDHELIKVKFQDFKDEKQKLINTIVEETESNLVTIIGNIAILFKRNLEKDNLIKL